ncbi:MAG: FIG001454: Transglutaminase-like enzymes, putative cysteine proteases, partial [uncultured Ramlibacter sp.]
ARSRPVAAARCARHPVPARRDRLGAAAAGGPAPVVVRRAHRLHSRLARRAGRAWRSPARQLVGAGPAGRHPRGDAGLASHGARPRRRGHADRGAAGPEDPGVAGPPRRLRGVLPRLLHHAHQLLLLAVPGDRGRDAGGPAGPAHGAGQRAHAGRPPAAGACGPHRELDGPAGRAHHAGAVHAVPAAGAAVGPARRQHDRAQRPVVHHAGGQRGAAGAGGRHRHAGEIRGPGASRPRPVLPRPGAVVLRRPRVEAAAAAAARLHRGPAAAHRLAGLRPTGALHGDHGAEQPALAAGAGRRHPGSFGARDGGGQRRRAAVDHEPARHRPAALQRREPRHLPGRPPDHRGRAAGAVPRTARLLRPSHAAAGHRNDAHRAGWRREQAGPGRGCARPASHRRLRLHAGPRHLWRAHRRRILVRPQAGLLRAHRLGLRRADARHGHPGAYRHRLPGRRAQPGRRLLDPAPQRRPCLGRGLAGGPRLGARRSDVRRGALAHRFAATPSCAPERLRPGAGQRQPGLAGQFPPVLGGREQQLEPVGVELHPEQAAEPAAQPRFQVAQLGGPELCADWHRGRRRAGGRRLGPLGAQPPGPVAAAAVAGAPPATRRRCAARTQQRPAPDGRGRHQPFRPRCATAGRLAAAPGGAALCPQRPRPPARAPARTEPPALARLPM